MHLSYRTLLNASVSVTQIIRQNFLGHLDITFNAAPVYANWTRNLLLLEILSRAPLVLTGLKGTAGDVVVVLECGGPGVPPFRVATGPAICTQKISYL